MQRGGNVKIDALGSTLEITTIHHSPGNLWDVLLFFCGKSRINCGYVAQKTIIKWFLTLHVKFVKYNENNEAVYAEPTFRSYTAVLCNASQCEEAIASSLRKLHNDYQNFKRDGSGWSIDQILKMEVHTAEYNQLNASSYVPLPTQIAQQKAVLKIINNDEKCVLYGVSLSVFIQC